MLLECYTYINISDFYCRNGREKRSSPAARKNFLSFRIGIFFQEKVEIGQYDIKVVHLLGSQPCWDQGGNKQPIHASPAGHGGTPNAGLTPSNTPAIPAAVPAHGPADLTHPTPTPGALWPEQQQAVAPSRHRR